MNEILATKRSPLRIMVILILVIFSSIIAMQFSEEFRLAEKPAEYIGVIFSILAASLFAVVSIVGDPSMIMPGGSRNAWTSALSIQEELQKFNFLFVWYLLTLGLLVASELIEHAKFTQFYWVTNVFVFFSVFGFLVSLFLPREFAKIQRRRLQQEIDSRVSSKKKQNG